MPRTAVFMESLDAFGDERCPLRLEPARALDGPIAQLDGHAQPWELKSLLQWFDHRHTDPLTNLPMDLQAIHPVLTPDIDRQAYQDALVDLTQRGWEGVPEVEADVARLQAYYLAQGNKRKKRTRGGGAPLAPFPDVVGLMRATESQTLWVRFRTARRERGIDRARFALDRDLCDSDFVTMKFGKSTRTRHFVASFMRHRFLAWSMPRDGLPIWMGLNRLYDDFIRLYMDLAEYPPMESRIRIISLMLGWAERKQLCIYHIGDDETGLVVGMEPYWLGYLWSNASPETRASLREPQRFDDIAHRLRDIDLYRAHDGGLRVELSLERFSDIVERSFTTLDDGHYALQLADEAILFPLCARAPFDPYTNERTLNALRDGLYAIEAAHRAEEREEDEEGAQTDQEEDGERSELED